MSASIPAYSERWLESMIDFFFFRSLNSFFSNIQKVELWAVESVYQTKEWAVQTFALAIV